MLQDDPRILETVIPNLTAYKALLVITGIQKTKILEQKKEQEKQERDAGRKVRFEPEEEKKMTPEELIYKKRIDEKLNISNTSHFSEAQKEKEMERLEREHYGVICNFNNYFQRMWIWDGYFHHNQKEKWIAAAEKL